MFKERFKRFIFSLIMIVFLFSNFNLNAQQPSTPELKTEAKSSFDKGSYENAYNKYLELIKRYPKDGQFHYYAGLSLFFMNKDYDKLIEHLEFASSKSTVSADVFYYLGQAYRKKYMFKESKTAFRKYAESAGRNELKELMPDREAEMSANAILQTMEYNPFEVLASSAFSFKDEKYTKNVAGKGGVLQKKPDNFYGKDEEKEELSSYMFMPKTVEKGAYIFYSGYGRTKKKGTELFRIKKTAGKGWGDPEPIDELNTPYNEIIPYFDPVSNDLYFASEGHTSMGGFDVFKSHYDQERDTWGEPVSLGFPVNSPENEYLVIPGSDLGTLDLITNRQGVDSMLTVFKLRLQEPKESLASADPEKIMSIAKFGGITLQAKKELKQEVKPAESEKLIAQKEDPSVSDSPESSVNPGKQNIYQTNLKTAMDLQVKSDSLATLAREARIKAGDINDAGERWGLQKQIIEWEKLSANFQDKANELFSNLNTVQEVANNSKKEEVPASIEVDTVLNGMTIYQFKSEIDKEKDTEPTLKPEEKKEKTEVYKKDLVKNEPGEIIKAPLKPTRQDHRFVVLKESPYNANNPFPMNVTIPAGAFYRIQLGVFSKEKEFDAFGGISPITGESIKEKGLIRYYAGKFGSYIDAQNALSTIKQLGYKDAYIVGWYNGEKISVSRIIELEKRDASE
jgi:hypothetical protein